MKSIGITGGIGSGKTTVARLFEEKGFLVYYADDRAKEVMNQDAELKDKLIELFGSDVYNADEKLDRPKLAKTVFNDPAKLALLNGVVHPAVARDFERWIKQLPANYSKPFVFKEAAILFEAGTSQASDAVLMVYAPKSIRLDRVIKRDQAEANAVISRMRNQWPDLKKCLLSEFVIFNDGLHPVEPQVDSAVKYFSERWK